MLWILFSLSGFIIFGVGPATVAAYSVNRSWINQEEKENTFKKFWRVYKENFIQANILWFIFFILGFVLYVDLYFIFRWDHSIAPILLGLVMFLAVIYAIVIIFSFPLLIVLKKGAIQSMKYGFIYAISSPILTITLFISLAVIQYISYQFPVAYLFLTVSVSSYFVLVVVQRISYKLNIEEV